VKRVSERVSEIGIEAVRGGGRRWNGARERRRRRAREGPPVRRRRFVERRKKEKTFQFPASYLGQHVFRDPGLFRGWYVVATQALPRCGDVLLVESSLKKGSKREREREGIERRLGEMASFLEKSFNASL